MKTTIFAAAAFVASAVADIGSAVVVNKCEYDVYLFNTPSSGGGYSEIDKTLSADGTYTQQWTELTNGNGWSIKLSNSTSLTDILQYEYTFHDDGTIWYDLSEVNGNPWDGNWEITSDSSDCSPKQQAYRYATDDAYGMQACPDSTTITVTLCSGESQDDSAASSVAASVSAESTTAAASTVASSKVSTTLATSVITSAPASSNGGAVTVTQTAYTTYWTHAWGGPSKRDAHAHHHAARHPHARE